jgi:DNA-binding transcriptional MerR regulator
MALYSIGTAARLSGLAVATLRNWEHRYGVIVASRNPAGQRLYSPSQIEDLRTLRDWTLSGLTAAEAHSLLEEQQRHPPSAASADALLDRRRALAALRTRAAATRAASAATRERSADTVRQLEALKQQLPEWTTPS